ncbi:VOC family protein [Kangiella shandongensis]|uniref:VOC family protein n=1 Tax=Kangiella shandongensis TaxID=2763258 RepID=UPI001CBAA100|nr:VOC family protein [Kangiella shandongensis]
MGKVVGVGGVFFKSKDRKALAQWYQDTLGFAIDPSYGGTSFLQTNAPDKACTVWGPFKEDTDYFEPSSREFMLNFIVDDIHQCLEQVESAGGTLIGEPSEDDMGIFGWFMDPEGNKIELWQVK